MDKSIKEINLNKGDAIWFLTDEVNEKIVTTLIANARLVSKESGWLDADKECWSKGSEGLKNAIRLGFSPHGFGKMGWNRVFGNKNPFFIGCQKVNFKELVYILLKHQRKE